VFLVFSRLLLERFQKGIHIPPFFSFFPGLEGGAVLPSLRNFLASFQSCFPVAEGHLDGVASHSLHGRVRLLEFSINQFLGQVG